ncbi:MAG: DUF6482 family protein [Congregibacter sp.]
MKITLRALRRQYVDKLVIESVDLSLYIAHAIYDGQRHLIVERDGKPLKTKNLLEMKSALSAVDAGVVVMQQRSAYDEMVGHSFDPAENQMEIPLAPGFETLPPWQH